MDTLNINVYKRLVKSLLVEIKNNFYVKIITKDLFTQLFTIKFTIIMLEALKYIKINI